jgi:hypothetical protein
MRDERSLCQGSYDDGYVVMAKTTSGFKFDIESSEDIRCWHEPLYNRFSSVQGTGGEVISPAGVRGLSDAQAKL